MAGAVIAGVIGGFLAGAFITARGSWRLTVAERHANNCARHYLAVGDEVMARSRSGPVPGPAVAALRDAHDDLAHALSQVPQ